MIATDAVQPTPYAHPAEKRFWTVSRWLVRLESWIILLPFTYAVIQLFRTSFLDVRLSDDVHRVMFSSLILGALPSLALIIQDICKRMAKRNESTTYQMVATVIAHLVIVNVFVYSAEFIYNMNHWLLTQYGPF